MPGNVGKRAERALGGPQDIEWAVGPGRKRSGAAALQTRRDGQVRHGERVASLARISMTPRSTWRCELAHTMRINRPSSGQCAGAPLDESRYQLIPRVRMGDWTAARVVTDTSTGAALAEALLPATIARTAIGTRTTRRKREKRRMVMKLLA